MVGVGNSGLAASRARQAVQRVATVAVAALLVVVGTAAVPGVGDPLSETAPSSEATQPAGTVDPLVTPDGGDDGLVTDLGTELDEAASSEPSAEQVPGEATSGTASADDADDESSATGGDVILDDAASAPAGMAMAMVSPEAVTEPAATAASTPSCPAAGGVGGTVSNTDPTYFDTNVAIFAGGSLTIGPKMSETEGLHVVIGDLVVEPNPAGDRKHYGIGVVGVGSGMVPPQGSTMLAVGGDVVLNREGLKLQVGDLNVGGAARIGGTIKAVSGAHVDAPYGGTVSVGVADAVTLWAGFRDQLATTSAGFAAYEPTGTAEYIGGGQLQLTGDGVTIPQVFEIPASALPDTGDKRVSALMLAGIPGSGSTGYAPVIINVTGSTVAFPTPAVFMAGVGPTAFETMGPAATSLLWNFPTAASLTITGNTQHVGSVVAPYADMVSEVSTNGRLYVGGNLYLNGVGQEHHNFPWSGPSTFGCGARFTIQKLVDNPADAAVPTDTAYTVRYRVTAPDGTTVLDGSRDLRAGEWWTSDTIPAGSTVHVSEPTLPGVAGITWRAPVIAPGVPATPDDGETVLVTVTNTPRVPGEPVDVPVSATKTVTGDAASLVGARDFTVTYSVTSGPHADLTGTFTVTSAGGPDVVGPTTTLPAGTFAVGDTVQLTENLPTDVAGVRWDQPRYDVTVNGEPAGNPFTITDAPDAQVTIAITNTARTLGLTVHKVDDDGEPMAGAAFSLSPDSGSPGTGLPGTALTAFDATTFTATGLLPGAYWLHETTTPGGYTPLDGPVAVEVHADGTVTLPGDDAAVALVGDATLRVTNTQILHDLLIAKVDGAGEPLGGAEFALLDGPTATPVPKVTGMFVLAGLAPGAYVLLETRAPDRHQLLAQPVRFTIDDAGTIRLSDDAQALVHVRATDGALEITNVRGPELPFAGVAGDWWTPTVLTALPLLLGGAAFALRRPRRGAAG